MFFSKDKAKEMAKTIESVSNETKNIEDNEPQSEEWIWVDGFKGTDKDLRCRDYQYKLGEKHIYEGTPEICSSGFHICLNLEDVFSYYAYNFSNRYFKVKALVKQSEAEKYGKLGSSGRVDKLVAKEIAFFEEVTHSENVFEVIKKKYEIIDTIEEFQAITDYTAFERNKFVNKISNYFNEAFSIILYDLISNKKHNENKAMISSHSYSSSYVYHLLSQNQVLWSDLKKVLDTTKALSDEGISKDMLTYLVLNSINR